MFEIDEGVCKYGDIVYSLLHLLILLVEEFLGEILSLQ